MLEEPMSMLSTIFILLPSDGRESGYLNQGQPHPQVELTSPLFIYAALCYI